ncbi:unnamed protein product [Paramecium octaurelia]|uniref:EGF-like domain-containing protein n=1 Tax=Paramecium octaurelia TaxID=43137 RepID=A0A8S1TI28_PAROT|nr:unnamed protein product [Paramecium octaurelia]
MNQQGTNLFMFIIFGLLKQCFSDCGYINSGSSLLSLTDPQQQIDISLDNLVLQGASNIGYGVWMKYQPFVPISQIATSSSTSGGMTFKATADSGSFIYLQQQKDTKFNMLTVYITISAASNTIMHNIFYSFQSTTGTVLFSFESGKYEGRWILFYVYYDLLQKQTTLGFYQAEQTISTKTKQLSDIPSLVKQVRHIIGGVQEIKNQLGETLSLSQFKGRISTLFSKEQLNIFLDLNSFLATCDITPSCEIKQYKLSGFNQVFTGNVFTNNSTKQLEYQNYVVQGWVKMDFLIDDNYLETVIFRITINSNYNDDMTIGDKELYLKYFQGMIPAQNGFSLTTYTYSFPVESKQQSSSTDIITVTGVQYQNLLISWHYIQYEIGTNNNDGQPLFSIFFPSLNQVLQYKWTVTINHFTGTILYYFVGGDNFIKTYLLGQLSDLTLTTYCTTPQITVNPKCHYSCDTCDGPGQSNCLSCPAGSFRIQSITQKTCTCKNKYVDIENDPICQPVTVKFPQLEEDEVEVVCNKIGFDSCDANAPKCLFGHFLYKNNCIQCPGYSLYSSRYQILCSNCFFDPNSFSQNLACSEDTKTYSYDDENAYFTTERENREIEFYTANLNLDGQYELTLQYGFLKAGTCKKGFYLDSKQQCSACLNGCETCVNKGICQKCFSNYALTDDYLCQECVGCSSCTFSNQIVYCTTCKTGTYLTSQGQCQSCGQYCASCNSQGICNYCDNPTLYFLSFDGKNCEICTIANCQICYHYFIKQGVTYTKLDITASVVDMAESQLFIGCALCQTNFYFNQITLQCEAAPQGSGSGSNGIDPVPPGDQNGKDIVVDTDSCSFGLILDSHGTTYCLISSTSITSTQITYCSTISNCQQCISDYLQANTFCIVCADGYYSSILTGKCNQCDSSCQTCIQQNKDYQDYWKWGIKAYYKYVLNSDDSHPFEQYATLTSESDFELICTSCPKGYVLNDFTCIKDCNEDCTDCDIINGVSTCTQCLETPYGFLKSQNAKGICLTCPNNCAACLERSTEEIQSINPFFVTSQTNIKYTRICYERFEYDSIEGQYYNDQTIQTISFCEKYGKCYHRAILKQNVYCQQSQYNQDLQQSTDQQVFLQNNIYIDELLTTGYLKVVETSSLYTYFNEKVIREVEFQFKFIQGNAPSCFIQSESKLQNKIQENVFSIQQVNLKLIGDQYPTTLIIDKTLSISNFASVSFENIQFQTAIQINAESKLSFIYLQNIQLKLSLIIKDCVFTTTNSTEQLKQFQFISDSAYSLTIDNLIMRDFKVQDSSIFQYQVSSGWEQQAIISKLQIVTSYFKNSNILNFLAKTNNLYVNLQLNEVSISDTRFDQSNFIHTETQLQYDIGSITVDTLNLIFVILNGKSTIFSVQGAASFITKTVTIQDLFIRNNSYFYYSNIIQISDFSVKNAIIQDSTLITNNVDYAISDDSLLNSAKISLSNCKIENLQYSNAQSILKLVSYEKIDTQTVSIDSFTLNNSLSLINSIPNYISYEQSNIYIECQQCKLNSVYIQRGYGLPEITIVRSQNLTIKNLYLSQSSAYYSKTLHQSYECVNNFAYSQMFHFLYIGFYRNITIKNLQLSNSITYNNPFIIIKGYDLMEKIENEQINVVDSIFDSNMLIITKANRATSIISILSEQSTTVTFSNVKFYYNHLNQYFQDLSRQSASTLLIQLQQGNFYLENSFFKQNLVTNTTDSILYLKAISVVITNTKFQKNNILQLSIIGQNILLPNDDQGDIDGKTLTNAFPINSKSGNGLLIATYLTLDKVRVEQSFSNYGGGFYINTQGISKIAIKNSKFLNTQTLMHSSSFSAGGCIYIDAQLSKLELTISSTTFDTSISRIEGGGIYIIPSQQENNIQMTNLNVVDCYSVKSSFLSFKPSSLDNIKSQIYMSGVIFENTEKGFNTFISLLISPTTTELDSIRNSNALISIKYASISISNCSFQSPQFSYFLDIESATNITLQNLEIINSTVLYSPLLKMSLRSQYSSNLMIKNLTVQNVIQKIQIVDNPCLVTSLIATRSFVCPLIATTQNKKLSDYDTTSVQQITMECNQYLIYQNVSYKFSLIEIDELKASHNFQAEDITFDSIKCSDCQYGIIRIKDIEKLDIENILFSNIKIRDSNCGQTGCLSLLQYESDSILRKDLLSSSLNSRVLQQHDYFNLTYNLIYQARILNSLFINNNAIYGGSIFIVEISSILHGCYFKNNSASVGGAIYYFSKQTQLYIFETQILENKAKIAGGLYLNSQSLQTTTQLDVYLSNNNSTLFGSDVFENPRSLTISLDAGKTFLTKKQISKTSTSIVEQIVITPYKILGYAEKSKFIMFPSGRAIGTYEYFDQYTSSYIPYNLTFRIIALNKYNTQEKELEGSTCTISPSIINSTSKETLSGLIGSLSYTTVKFNQTSGDFNLDDLIIYFNPTYEPEIIMQLSIFCNIISIPQYQSTPPYSINNTITNYRLLVDIKTFNCQLGEYQNGTTGGCTLCDTVQNQYQVQWSAQSCSYKDDQKMKSIESSMIELRSGYWRAYYYSQTVEYCYHLPSNCEGGWKPGDQSCIQGHIGALCEQCDLYNIQSQGSYSVSSKYSCGSCDQIIGNVLTIFFISVWTLISILMSVNSTVEMIEEFIAGLRLKAFGFTVLIKPASTAIFIKAFTNYLQIISTIATFQLEVPSGLASVVNSVGNPIESMAYSLDCFLIRITDIEIIYFRIIWSLLLATSYILAFFIIQGVQILAKSIKYNTAFVSTALIYVFIYLQPNLIGGLISLVSYRIISDEYWIQGNVSYRYDTYSHAKWLISFCFPLLLLFSFVIPVFFFYGVRNNRGQLNKTLVRQKWGYLYNEYKIHAYYWETIKILQKELIIIVLAYYDDHIAIKASLVFLVLFGYSFVTTSQKPYISGELNYLDTQSTIVCAVSIILGSSINTAQKSNLVEIVWPFYIIITILNAYFIFKMLIKILFAYFDKLHEQIDKVKELMINNFPNLIKRHPFIQDLFESRKKQKARVKDRFNKIKNHLLPQAKLILQYKKQNNLDLPGRINTQLSDLGDDANQKKREKNIDINLCAINPLSPECNSDKDSNVDSLFKKPQSSKVYPELIIHYMNQDSLKSSIHHSQS